MFGFDRMMGAILRGVLIFFAVFLPSAVLYKGALNGLTIVAIFALFCALIVTLEYASKTPGVVEFVRAPPYNRLRFILVLLVLTYLVVEELRMDQSWGLFDLSARISNAGDLIFGQILPITPWLFLLLNFPSESQIAASQHIASGALLLAFGLSFLFGLFLWVSKWPLSRSGFNLSPNMPTLSLQATDKTEQRLMAAGILGLVLALTFPLLLAFGIGYFVDAIYIPDEQAPVFSFWIIATWSLVPAIAIYRSLAILKVAFMVYHLRLIS